MLNGKKIRNARNNLGVSQTTIDMALSRPFGTCAKLEDNRATLNPDELKILCDILKVDVLWLLDGEKPAALPPAKAKPDDRPLGERVAEYFNRELKKYQKRTGKSMSEIARDTGVCVNTLLNIKKRGSLLEVTAEALAKATEIDLRKVLRDGEEFKDAHVFQTSGERAELRARVGKLLESELEKKNISQIEFASMIGTSGAHVTGICHGHACPSKEVVQNIFDATGIDLRKALREGEKFYPRTKRWVPVELGQIEAPAQEAPKTEPEQPVEEAPKPEPKQDPVPTGNAGLKMQLLRMHAEMLTLKTQLGYDVAKEYEGLVKDLLAEVGG